ncbi:MAG: PEP-CTERM sorting domain-containing protein [Planctomycetota bacterium]
MLHTHITTVVATAAVATSASASILTETFDGPTLGDTIFTAGGFEGSSDGGVAFTKDIAPTAGVGGSGAYELTATIDSDGLGDDGAGNFFFFGAGQAFVPLNLAGFTPSDISFTADVANGSTSSDGGPVKIALQDETTGQAFDFVSTPVGDATQFSTIGGTLDTANIANPAATLSDGNYSIFIQFENVFPGSGYDFSANAVNTVFFDNVSITVIPEPASAAALGLLGLVGLRRRR